MRAPPRGEPLGLAQARGGHAGRGAVGERAQQPCRLAREEGGERGAHLALVVGARGEQLLAPASLYSLSLPQTAQSLEPAGANFPAAHSTTTLVPSHAEPDGQPPQVVRVLAVPPDVKEPGPHASHAGAAFPLNK